MTHAQLHRGATWVFVSAKGDVQLSDLGMAGGIAETLTYDLDHGSRCFSI
ncbi:MAG: hypothetical protein O2863_00590 [Actinomycetota bacterium]|nr:hypothetical protein [Actinomycetota bacterium]